MWFLGLHSFSTQKSVWKFDRGFYAAGTKQGRGGNNYEFAVILCMLYLRNRTD